MIKIEANNGRRSDLQGFKVVTQQLCSPLASGVFELWYNTCIDSTMNLQKPAFFFLSKMQAEDWASMLMQTEDNLHRWDSSRPLQVWSAVLYRPSACPLRVLQPERCDLYNTFWKVWYGPDRKDRNILENNPDAISNMPEFYEAVTIPVPPSTVLAFRFSFKRRVH